MTRDEIISVLDLSERRLNHTFGVEKAALKLAERHFPELKSDEVSAAALLHDLTKEYSYEKQLETADFYKIQLTPLQRATKKLLHSKTAAAIAKDRLGMSDTVCDAVYYHTTARADMTPLEKVIYFADYIEDNRTDESCVSVRDYYEALFAEGDGKALDKGLLFSCNISINLLLGENAPIDSDTFEARNFLIFKGVVI